MLRVSTMEGGSNYLHILILPWLAFGHLLPYLELSKCLARNGHRISFLSTPKNITRLPIIPPPLSRLITFIEFPLPRIQHLPENAEATIDLPSDDLRPYLRKAFDAMAHKLTNLIEHLQQISDPLDCIIYDYAAYWVPPIADKLGVPCAFFGLHNAAAFAFFGPPTVLMGGEGARKTAEEFTAQPSWIPFPSAIKYRSHEARELFEPGVIPDASGVSEAYRFGRSIQGSQIVLVRSCNEFEAEWLQLLGRLYEKPVIPVGLLPPSVDQQGWHEALGWLEGQEQGTVVYAAFGSEVKLSAAQVKEIGLGLELSRLPFVWAVRAESVPDGLVERVKRQGRGLVCVGWVPQVRVLGHRSVGGFLTHGGWNSIVEGLGLGRAMVVLPMVFDQGLNARNMVEKGLGVEVPRKEEDGSFTGDGIAASLRLAMVEEEGEVFRARARDCRKVFGDVELHDGYVRELVENLRHYAKRPAVLAGAEKPILPVT